MKFQHNYHYVPKELITNKAIHTAVVYALECAGGKFTEEYGQYENSSKGLGLAIDADMDILWVAYGAERPVTLQQVFNHEDFKWPEGMDKIGYVDNRVVFYNGQGYCYLSNPKDRYNFEYIVNRGLCELTLIATKENKGENTMSNQFTKDMLVAGKHVVEYRDGSRRLVVLVGKWLGMVGVYGQDWLKNHNENLVHRSHYELDIVKVYEIGDLYRFDKLLDEDNLELIWRREERSQQEIEYENLITKITELQKQAEKLKPV